MIHVTISLILLFLCGVLVTRLSKYLKRRSEVRRARLLDDLAAAEARVLEATEIVRGETVELAAEVDHVIDEMGKIDAAQRAAAKRRRNDPSKLLHWMVPDKEKKDYMDWFDYEKRKN